MTQKKDIFDRIMSRGVFRPLEPIYSKYKEALLYIFFGGWTTVVGVGSYWILIQQGLNALVANVISWILAVLFAYVTNSIWVFDGRTEGLRDKIRQILSFYGGRAATLLMEEGILLIFVEILQFHALLVKIAAQILVLVGNYLISKWVVFRRK